MVDQSPPIVDSNSAREYICGELLRFFCERLPTRIKDEFQKTSDNVLREQHDLKGDFQSSRLAEGLANILLSIINEYTQVHSKSEEPPKNERRSPKDAKDRMLCHSPETKYMDLLTSNMELVSFPVNPREHKDIGPIHTVVKKEL